MWPKWWHHHGIKMRFEGLEHGVLKMASSAACVEIRLHDTRENYEVCWEVIQFVGTAWSRGQRLVTEEQLRVMFGLDNDFVTPGHSQWLIKEYEADVAEQTLFIRKGNYLNIPCPGTAHDGDPNVSIELDDEIKEKVKELISESVSI